MKPTWKYLLLLTVLLNLFTLKFFSQAPANFNFELSTPGTYTTANAVAGWTVESATQGTTTGQLCVLNPSLTWVPGSPEFSVLSTPIASVTALPWSINSQNLALSPLGGSNIVRLNDIQGVPARLTKLSRQFTVTANSVFLQYAFAGSWDGGMHNCCENAGFSIELYSCLTNSLLSCHSRSFVSSSSFCVGTPGYSVNSGISWTNWQTFNVDLSLYIGQCLTLVVKTFDCSYGGHHGTLYFDAKLGPYSNGPIGNGLSVFPLHDPSGTGVNFCAGSNIAVLTAPPGYASYQWIAPGGFLIPAPLGANSTYTVINPAPGHTYSVILTSQTGCFYVLARTLNFTQVAINNLISQASCLGGSSGSATVFVSGSGSGYNFTWLGAGNNTVGTTQVATGLSPGTYTVLVSSNSSSTCGSASSTIAVTSYSANLLTELQKPYCSNEAYFCASAGSNYQWYNGTVAIAPPLGTAQCYTLNNPGNGNFVHLKYLSAFGCQDSVKYSLLSSMPGSLSIQSSFYTCQGTSIGSAVISHTPTLGMFSAQNTFSVFSTGTINPAFSVSVSLTVQNSFSLSSLSANTYSVIGFDGSCRYTNTFSIINHPDNFTLSPASAYICPGGAIAVGVYFSSPPGPSQYSYSWSPTTWMPGNNGTFQSTILTPNLAPGTTSTIVYTVVVTPSVINCPIAKTLSITAFGSPIQATISPIPLLCNNSGLYTISVNPPGGNFVFANSLISSNPILNPNNFNPGTYSLSYSIGNPACVTGTQSFQIGGPNLSLSGNLNICVGNTSTLVASGANSYTWNTGAISSSIVVSPTVNTIYSVTASHTTDACTSTKTIQVQVLNPPTIQISGSTSLCVNQSGSLQASGANTYTWNTGLNNSSIIVSPLNNTVYTVSGSNFLPNCIGQQSIQVLVNPGPLIEFNGPNTVCESEPFTIVITGADSYTWNASPSTWTNSAGGSSFSASQVATNIYSVTVSSFNNPCSVQHTYTVNSSPCTEISETSSKREISIYPNPSSGIFTIEGATNLEISVYNSLGQFVLSKNLLPGKQTIDLSGQASGIYFMTFKTNGISKVVRLVKQE